jgi:hypothetical protein
MQILKAQLEKIIYSLPAADRDTIEKHFGELTSSYPFNDQEYIISNLLALGAITLADYLNMREEYMKRNVFLPLFEISAPRMFGEKWAQGHLKILVPGLIKPTKKIEKSYSGQYDFLYPKLDKKMIKIEVKASRAVDFNSREPLYVKALEWNSKKYFDMNFQQIKPKCCDVFIWVGVWKDVIKYWVLSSQEVEGNKAYSTGQHRGNSGEGQLHLKRDNIGDFAKFEVLPEKLSKKIIEAYAR